MAIDKEKLFAAAAKRGFTIFELSSSRQDKLTISTYNGETETYMIADDFGMNMRGILDGKGGSFKTDRADDAIIEQALDAVATSAKYGQPIDEDLFVGGGEYEYEKVDTFSEALDAIPPAELKALCERLSTAALKADSRVYNANADIEYLRGVKTLSNSKGLDLEAKFNNITVVLSCEAKQDGEPVSHYEYYILPSMDGFDEAEFVKKTVDGTVKQFGGSTVDSGKYKVVFSDNCVATLTEALMDAFSAFDAEQHLSLLEGKIGEQVFSKHLTITEEPIGNAPYCFPFDSEGVPCKNKTLVDKGVPTGFVYDLATAKRAGVKSTGNGRTAGGNVRPAVSCAAIESGKMTLDELFGHVGDGLYITSLGGVSTGLDRQSGNYSLEASGYRIEKGNLTSPVSLITVAGNLMETFAGITAVGKDRKFTFYNIVAPAIAVDVQSISGK
ncbi:MAG: TldD/PmbA family protein [Clostridiales bacterium]|nr:TldD/PmbA family protein [Clostridiales bacterium]